MAGPTSSSNGPVSRIRGASVSMLKANPQLGVWQAAGTAIAHAPNLTELRDPGSGGSKIAFNAQGHSARVAVQESGGDLALATSRKKRPLVSTSVVSEMPVEEVDGPVDPIAEAQLTSLEETHHAQHAHWTLPRIHLHHHQQQRSLHERHRNHLKEKWGPTIVHGLKAFWKFFATPSGFLITIYSLNIVAWGAMLFFLLLKAAPAMNHPTADDDSSPRKKWLEIDSQILNALFCVTGFGLAPWRFRDLYLYISAIHFKNRSAMQKLSQQNKSWFRPHPTYSEQGQTDTTSNKTGAVTHTMTFTGEKAPPTAMWKLGFTIWMMVLNTILQAVLCYYMWGYNRIDRPSWATGTFIALGCCVAMFAGLMSWWEGRKVKKIEGPVVEIVEGTA